MKQNKKAVQVPRHTYTVDKFKKHIDPNADEKLKYLDLRFDNTCNQHVECGSQ